MAADFEGPLDDFYKRTEQIRLVVTAVEAAARESAVLTSERANVDLRSVNLTTGNTVNSMSIVFLASSFEEFVREEMMQCAEHLSSKYQNLDIDVRNSVRNSYWMACLESLRKSQSILTKSSPKTIDVPALGNVNALLNSALGFVVSDDASLIEHSIFSLHPHNFRPHVVDEIAQRLGIKRLMHNAADSQRIHAIFATTTKSEAAERLKRKLDEFYEVRNRVVHSLNGQTGFAVDVVFGYLDLFEATAESIRNVLLRTTARW